MAIVYVPAGRSASLSRYNGFVDALYVDIIPDSMVLVCVNGTDDTVLLSHVVPSTNLVAVKNEIEQFGLCRILICYRTIEPTRLQALRETLAEIKTVNRINKYGLDDVYTGITIFVNHSDSLTKAPELFLNKDNQLPSPIWRHPQHLALANFYIVEEFLLSVTSGSTAYQPYEGRTIFNGYGWVAIENNVLDLCHFREQGGDLGVLIEKIYTENPSWLNIFVMLSKFSVASLKSNSNQQCNEFDSLSHLKINIVAAYLEERIYGFSKINTLFRRNLKEMMQLNWDNKCFVNKHDRSIYDQLAQNILAIDHGTEVSDKIFKKNVCRLMCEDKNRSATAVPIEILLFLIEHMKHREGARKQLKECKKFLNLHRKLLNTLNTPYSQHEYEGGYAATQNVLKILLQYGFFNISDFGKAYYWLGVFALQLKKNNTACSAARVSVTFLQHCLTPQDPELLKAQRLLADVEQRSQPASFPSPTPSS